MKPCLLRRLVATGCLAAGCAPKAAPQEPQRFLYPRVEIDAGGAFLVLGDRLRIDPKERPDLGTEIDAETVLGVSKTTFQPRVTARWRPWRRHELEAGFLPAVRSAEQTLTRTIVVGDTSFAAGARINSVLRTSQAFVAYRFAFMAREATQLGAAVGIGAVFFRAQIDALAGSTGGGSDTSRVEYSETHEATGPTASVGMYGRFRLGDRWYLESELRGIYLEIDKYEVHILEGGAAGRYFFSPRAGAELGYGLGYYRESVSQVSGRGLLESDFSGRFHYIVHGFRGGIVIQF